MKNAADLGFQGIPEYNLDEPLEIKEDDDNQNEVENNIHGNDGENGTALGVECVNNNDANSIDGKFWLGWSRSMDGGLMRIPRVTV